MRIPSSCWPLAVLSLCLSFVAACAPMRLAGYAVNPDYPQWEPDQTVAIPGLGAPVDATRRADGLWRIFAPNEADAMRAQGYLVASDRMFQLDLFRHMARGELSELLGNRKLGAKTTLEADVMNRFLGFRRVAEELITRTSAAERAMLIAYTAGINAWLKEGKLSLEHRLLGVSEVRPWEPVDSISIYAMLMHSLSGNADREVRRLLIACEAGLGAVERVFPNDVEFAGATLPEEDFPLGRHRLPPAVVPEVAAQLPALCRAGRTDLYRGVDRAAVLSPSTQRQARVDDSVANALASGDVVLPDSFTGLASLSSSNNWVVTGPLSASGWNVLSGDPHLPHMNPPIVWGVEIVTPENHVAGFAIPGLHRVVFGHNGHVAWSATTNHVDRQDLVLHQPRTQVRGGQQVHGYEVDGKFVAYEYRREHFAVRDGSSVDALVRFTRDGPLLNDIDSAITGKIPLVSLRMASMGAGLDLDGAAEINRARSARDFIAGIEKFDLGCSNWVYADDRGEFGYRSPCRLPVRAGWRGTFPIPGWLRRYDWSGYVPKSRLPKSTNPERGWLVTANSRILPADRFFTPYNNDSSAPNRLRRISERLATDVSRGVTRDSSAAIQMDVVHEPWPAIRDILSAEICLPGIGPEMESLCRWDGAFRADSVAATIFVHWTNAILDRALADALPGGASGPTWRYVQELPQFESVVQWLWTRPASDPIWDDATTGPRESRQTILAAALGDAIAESRRRYGADLAGWQWGTVRPFVLRHPFAGDDGVAGELLNAPPLNLGGDTETVFKQQFVRADRQRMTPAIGPVVRFTVDMAQPWSATYSLAGGESGWPGSPHYGDLLADWGAGRGRLLTPSPGAGDVRVRFVAAD